MTEPQKARIKRTLKHMSEGDRNITYDKYTAEIQYDGINAPDSDVRKLLLLSTHSMTLASGRGSDIPSCGPPASFSVHLASSTVTPGVCPQILG